MGGVTACGFSVDQVKENDSFLALDGAFLEVRGCCCLIPALFAPQRQPVVLRSMSDIEIVPPIDQNVRCSVLVLSVRPELHYDRHKRSHTVERNTAMRIPYTS